MNSFSANSRGRLKGLKDRPVECGLSQADVKPIIISNGEDFLEIPAEDLVDALNDGFYLPRDRGLTIVSNGEDVFEIPVGDVAEALQEGFRDLCADGRLPNGPTAETAPAEAAAPTVSDSAASDQVVSGVAEVTASAADTLQTSSAVASSATTVPSEPAVSETPHGESESDVPSVDVEVASSFTPPEAAAESVSGLGDVAVEESDDAEAERRRELEAAIAEAQGFEKLKLLVALHAPTRRDINRFMRSYGASTLLHAVLIVILWNIVYATPASPIMSVISSVLNNDEDLIAEEDALPVEIDQSEDSTETSDDVSQMQEMMAITQLAKVDLSLETLKIDLDLGAGEAAAAESANGGGMMQSGAATKGAMGARSKATSKYGGTPSSEAAVEAALDWLARHQAPDGSWGFNHLSTTSGCTCANSGTSEGRTGATGAALLTYFGAGYTYADGPRAVTVRKGLQYLLQSINVNPAGYGDLKGGDNGNGGIYQHGLATAALCEAFAINRVLIKMVQRDRNVNFVDPSGQEVTIKDLVKLGKVLQNACQLTVNYLVFHQDPKKGGWGYKPKSAGDTSILGWQVMALISAQSEQLETPAATWRGISNYLRTVEVGSGYAYREGAGQKKSTTAIGVLCGMYTGAKRSNTKLKASVEYLNGQGPSLGEMYYNYYATQAIFAWGDEAGDDSPKLWTQWNNKTRDMLVASQRKAGHETGSWIGTEHAQGGRHFTTCLAAMTLEIYYRKLPVYQRLSLDVMELK